MKTGNAGKRNIALLILSAALGVYCLFGPGPLLRRSAPAVPETALSEEEDAARRESETLRAERDALADALAEAEEENDALRAELERLAPFRAADEADREAEEAYVRDLERQLERMSEEERIANTFTLTLGQHTVGDRSWDYWLYDPNLPGRTEPLPLIVYLHGSRGSGTNPELLVRSDPGLGRYLSEGKVAVNALVLIPQSNCGWIQGYDELAALIEWAVEAYGADPERVSLVGCSAGGVACFEMLKRYDGMFCCCAAIGAATNANAAAQIKTPMRIYHGVNDSRMGTSVKMAAELINANGGSAELIMMEHTWHSEQVVLYESEWGLWDWVLAQKR